MIKHQHSSIAITDRSSIGEARRISTQMAERARIKDVEHGRVPLIVTELATNLLLHATGGEILIRMLPLEAGPGIEIIALDRGPGIADIERCMADGYSGGSTAGNGLGAVRRLSTEFEIYSKPPVGTVVLSRVRSINRNSHDAVKFSAINVPAPNETESGDAWHLWMADGRLSAMVVDGLGHGPLAAIAAARALQVIEEGAFESPETYLLAAHLALRSSRGAALAMTQVHLALGTLSYAGIGNIVGRVICPTGLSKSLLSHNGIVGVEMPKPQQFEHPWQNGDLLVMHSDGLSERWKLEGYAGLAHADTAVIAAVLYRDAKRRRDDTTILVARLTAN
jgi:anti-sigma regulatory factor (Ser/Thr protein kinase)